MTFRRFLAGADRFAWPLPVTSLALACGGAAGVGAWPRCESPPSGEHAWSTKLVARPHGQRVKAGGGRPTWLHWSHRGQNHISMVWRPAVDEESQDSRGTVTGRKRAVRSHSEEDVQRHATRTFEVFAAEDGVLGYADVEAAVRIFSLGHGDDGLPWVLGPLLWRLMDKDQNGRVTRKEFIHGQQLLTAAKCADFRSDTPTNAVVEELCWRALSANRDGTVRKTELSRVVRLMLHLGAVDSEALEEINLTWAAKKVRYEKTGNGHCTTFQLEAVDYFMHLCDLDGDGIISREDLSNCRSLQYNFWLLLRKPEVDPVFLVRGINVGGACK